MPGVPGLFLESQKDGWKKVADAVHQKGGYIYMQLWHSGRANTHHFTGTPTLCPSATLWDDPEENFMYPIPHTSKPVKYRSSPPQELSVAHIKKTIEDDKSDWNINLDSTL